MQQSSVFNRTAENSVGLVETDTVTFKGDDYILNLESGKTLSPVTVVYETYGRLSRAEITPFWSDTP